MGRQVLILNADYSAISICTVPKAFLLVYLNKAELVADSEKYQIRTIDRAYPSPSIIRLNKYVNVPYKSVLLNRTNIFKRDDNACTYCGSAKDLTLDHVMPKSRGGKTSWENLITACKRCNSKKGHQTPEEANMPLARKPFRPSFVVFVRSYASKLEDKWLPFLNSKM
jgi:5-methylcytosine-specific restriction endonuclease McrA